MVRRVFRLLNREISGLHEAAYLVGISSIASQLLALFRDRLFAHTFGAGKELDVYYAAFRIPDLIYVSIASFVSVTVLIPFLTARLKHDDGSKEARDFLNSVLTVFLSVMVLVSVVVYVLVPYFSHAIAPGFDPDANNSLVLLTRILLLSPIFLGLSNLVGSVTQSMHRFFVYAVSPIVYNVGIIIGIIFFYPILGTTGLVWGVVLGAFLHLAVQLPAIISSRFAPRLTLRINWKEIRDVVFLSLPRTLGLGFSQVASIVLIAIASTIESGSISIFNLSFNLQSVPLSIIGVSYSVAAFPTLAKLFSSGDRERFVGQIVSATRHILFWSLPVTALFIVLRAQIVRVILGSGRFNWTDTRLTAAALALFCVSLFAQSVVLLLVRGYYAAGNTRVPLLRNFLSSVAIIAIALFGVKFYLSSDALQEAAKLILRTDGASDVQVVSGGAVLFLPFAYSVGMFMDAVVLWFGFKRDFGLKNVSVLGGTFFQSFAASAVLAVVSYLSLRILENIFDVHGFVGIFMQGLFAGVAGIIAATAVLYIAGSTELTEIWKYVNRKFWNVRPIAQSPDQL